MTIASSVKASGGKMKQDLCMEQKSANSTHGIKTEQILVCETKANIRNIQLGVTHLKQA